MCRGRAVTWVLCGSIRVLPALAAAEPVACQRPIVRESAKFREAVSKALQGCEDKRVGGKLPPTVDCRAVPEVAAARQKAGDALQSGIARACGGRNRVCDATDVG